MVAKSGSKILLLLFLAKYREKSESEQRFGSKSSKTKIKITTVIFGYVSGSFGIW